MKFCINRALFYYFLGAYYPNQTCEVNQQYPAMLSDAQMQNQQPMAGQIAATGYQQGAAQWDPAQTQQSAVAPVQGHQQQWDMSQAGGQQQAEAAWNPEQPKYEGSYTHYTNQTSQGIICIC